MIYHISDGRFPLYTIYGRRTSHTQVRALTLRCVNTTPDKYQYVCATDNKNSTD